MSFQADTRYDVVIQAVRRTVSEQSGKLSLNVRLEHPEHGPIYTDIWLTEAAAKSTRRTLAEFGFTDDQKIRALIVTEGKALEGQRATILTKLDTYNGKTKVKVAFLNGPLREIPEAKPVSPEAIRAALALFGASEIELDEEVPF